VWKYLPGKHDDNVLFATWYDGLAPLPGDVALSAQVFEHLLALRDQVSKVLEPMRADGEIGAALEAEITLCVGVADQNWLAPLVDELRFLLISGDVTLEADNAVREIGVVATRTRKQKCVRCWHYRADVGARPEHPEICSRCESNIEGSGEDRRWF